MEMKSVSNCLDFIDSMIICNIAKRVGVGILEDLRDCMMELYDENYIEEKVALLAILSQINLIIYRFHLDNDSDNGQLYLTLRKRIIA